MREIDLSKVSVEEIMAEIEKRKKQNNPQTDIASSADDYMAPIGDSALKPGLQACKDAKDLEIQRLKKELECNEMEKRVLQHQIAVEKEMEQMHEEHLALGERVRAFQEECHRRIQATSTTEQLSLFHW